LTTPPCLLDQTEDNAVNRNMTVGLAMLGSAALGVAAVQTLHAQAKPLAFQITEITVNNQDGYSKEFLPVIGKLTTDAGGKFLARGGKTISVQGAPPEPRIVVVQYDSLDKMQALFDSPAFKQAIAVGNKYATQRTFGVEGVSP
jgi:uncharacterized protein (DUF1330 family)